MRMDVIVKCDESNLTELSCCIRSIKINRKLLLKKGFYGDGRVIVSKPDICLYILKSSCQV